MLTGVYVPASFFTRLYSYFTHSSDNDGWLLSLMSEYELNNQTPLSAIIQGVVMGLAITFTISMAILTYKKCVKEKIKTNEDGFVKMSSDNTV